MKDAEDGGRRPAAIRLVKVRLPMVVPHLSAHGAELEREVVLVGWLDEDGVTGWGECPTLSGPGYVTETTEVAWQALVRHLAPAVLGDRVGPPEARPAGLLAAPSALADAGLDAELRRAGSSLRAHLGGTRPTLSRCAVLAAVGAPAEEIAVRARAAVAAGASMVKVKIAPGHDLEVLGAVVEAVGARSVAADGNGSFEHPAQLAAVDALGLRYLEQPFSPDLAWADLAGLHRQLATRVALDESLTSPGAVREALDAGAAGIVSVKPARLGGVEAAASAVSAAEDAGVDAFVGGMLELGIGRAAASAVATLPGCTLPTDLGPGGQYVTRDICEPVHTDRAGHLVPPDGPGIGRTPDEDALSHFTVEEAVLRRDR